MGCAQSLFSLSIIYEDGKKGININRTTPLKNCSNAENSSLTLKVWECVALQLQLLLLAMQHLAAGLDGCVRRPACKTTGASRVFLLPQPSHTRGVGLIPAAVGVEDSERRGAVSQPVNHTHTALLTHAIDLPFPNWRAAAGIFSSPTLAANHTHTHTHTLSVRFSGV